jgi:hypothetical protein
MYSYRRFPACSRKLWNYNLVASKATRSQQCVRFSYADFVQLHAAIIFECPVNLGYEIYFKQLSISAAVRIYHCCETDPLCRFRTQPRHYSGSSSGLHVPIDGYSCSFPFLSRIPAVATGILAPKSGTLTYLFVSCLRMMRVSTDTGTCPYRNDSGRDIGTG